LNSIEQLIEKAIANSEIWLSMVLLTQSQVVAFEAFDLIFGYPNKFLAVVFPSIALR
jgi:hypothetical protein